MDVTKLIRSASHIHAALQELPDGRLVALKQVKIYIPTRFVEHDLAYIGIENYIVGIYAITVDDTYYGVSTVNAMINISPSDITKIKIDGDEYYEFLFVKGATVFKSLNLVKVDILTYKIYDEFFAKAAIPWYLSYNDLGKLFDTAKYHAGANIGQQQTVTELIVSIIARNKEDRTKYYRTAITSLNDLKTNPPCYIALRSVTYAATNTTNRLGGSYFSTGVVASLVNETTRVERIESLLTL
jgi:hypothetical protein